MAWYKVGTITVTNGSTTVTGSGTQWIANAAVGEALYAPDGRLYEITNIASNTSFTIAPAYLGSTASGQSYVIVPSQSYIRDLASQAADLVNQYSTIANFAGQGKFGDGTVTAPGIRFSDDLDTGIYRIGSNNLGISAGGTKIVDVSSSGITVTGTINGTTLPTSATLVTTTGTQTLTNKTLTSPVLNTPTLSGGTINNTPIGGTTPNTGAFTNLSYTGTLTGSTGILNIGSGQVYKDASGNVGIGTSSPSYKLAVSGQTSVAVSGSNAQLRLERTGSSAGSAWLGASSTALLTVLDSSFSEYFRIDSAGNVGIGTSSPDNKLQVDINENTAYSSTAQNIETIRVRNLSAGTGRFAGIQFETQANDGNVSRFTIGAVSPATGVPPAFVFQQRTGTGTTNWAERMRIDSSGNLLVGVTSGSGKFTVGTSTSFTGTNIRTDSQTAGSTAWNHIYGTSSNNTANSFVIYGNGNIQNINNSYGALSDIKLKENVADATPKLDNLLQVRVVNYNLIGETTKQIGVIAQELEQIFPGVVEEVPDRDKEGNSLGTTSKSVKYSVFVPMLIKAMQEQQAQIEQLRAEIETLKGE
jgi:hypothetical protein